MRAKERGLRDGSGFTLLEVLLALMVFSIAVVALVEAINLSGLASSESRLEGRVQARLETLLLEATRLSQLGGTEFPPELVDTKVTEDGVAYHIQTVELELDNMDGERLTGLYAARVTATWRESMQTQTAEAETWFWPPLFAAER
ncbi:prepilin-type N-terminal cleavage/methylation domain-containing protein [Phragmitibacter flavus]|uniref:Prepilin-type N-terminal cleavage/methylation domain-containing protein n=1 Tax=Phragmitibacter flavus TaxID=2576071 RepID=A0A5R8KIV3_9BACT|nr:prepilin-type N-terminal cleavage/methylation domain-containing protein [Phragmitibacter flavus]TLD72187.1 prepilin-type N-terminal cleavage/methylation domain-containing protein [Phragmitibacter flavus]